MQWLKHGIPVKIAARHRILSVTKTFGCSMKWNCCLFTKRCPPPLHATNLRLSFWHFPAFYWYRERQRSNLGERGMTCSKGPQPSWYALYPVSYWGVLHATVLIFFFYVTSPKMPSCCVPCCVIQDGITNMHDRSLPRFQNRGLAYTLRIFCSLRTQIKR